jgi:hypothetical protein
MEAVLFERAAADGRRGPMRPDIRTRRQRPVLELLPPFRTNIGSYPIGYADGLKRAQATSGGNENYPLNLNKRRYRWLSDVYAMGHG